MKYLLVVCMICFVIGCKKSNDAGSNAVTNDSIYISQVFRIDQTTNDTSYINFTYDNQKRVSRIVRLGFNTASRRLDTTGIFTYSYLGSEVRPYGVVIAGQPWTGFFRTHYHFMSYEGQLRLKRDSITEIDFYAGQPPSSPKILTHVYTYLNDGFVDSIYFYTPTAGNYFTRVYTIKNAVGQIVNELKTSPEKYEYRLEYDQRPNPLYKITSIEAPYMESQNYLDMDVIGKRIAAQKNNLTKITKLKYFGQTNNVSSMEVTDFRITYRNDGYPLVIYTTTTPFQSNDKYKIVFVYRN
jgi:hypothetical protein